MSGKFFPELADEPVIAAKRQEKPKVSIADRVGEKGCNNCVMKKNWHKLSTKKMPIFGNIDGDILILGPLPSKEDDAAGTPYSDEAGKLLRSAIPHIYRDSVCYAYLVRCAGGYIAQAEAVHSCSIYLDWDIPELNIKAILGIGQEALSSVWPGAHCIRSMVLNFL